MAFALGVRHGFDLDHLAIIDAITRTVKENVRLSKFVGFLFSFGHGLIVILMSLIIGSGIIQARSPLWLESFGQWTSITFLFIFGLITLWNILPNSLVLPTSLRGFLFRKLLGSVDHSSSDAQRPATCSRDPNILLNAQHYCTETDRSGTREQVVGRRSLNCQQTLGEKYNPFLIMLIGALFAFSFDTFTQVALFSISVSVMAGLLFTIILGVFFMLGMMASDGLNGLFVCSLIQLADKKSRIISRVTGLVIALFSLILGFLGLLNKLAIS